LSRKRHSFFVTCCDLEIEFSEVILACFISIRWLWNHPKIEIEKFRHTIISFVCDCNKADSVLRTSVKESNVGWRFWLSILVPIYRPNESRGIPFGIESRSTGMHFWKINRRRKATCFRSLLRDLNQMTVDRESVRNSSRKQYHVNG
jgi:hypothetical protein